MKELELLNKLGLTEYESRVLLSLIRLGPSTVRDIVAESKVPKNKAYETLSKLEGKNLVVTLPITPKRYKVENLEKLKEIAKQKKEEFERVQKELDSFETMLAHPAVNEYKEFFWVIKGQKAIQEKLRLQDEKTKFEALSIQRLSRALPGHLRSLKKAINNGAKFKMICPITEKNFDAVKAWQHSGAEIRVYNEKKYGPVIPRFSVFDKKTVRITIGKPEVKSSEDYLSLWTESQTLAVIFRNYFLTMWEDCEPFEKYLKRMKKIS